MFRTSVNSHSPTCLNQLHLDPTQWVKAFNSWIEEIDTLTRFCLKWTVITCLWEISNLEVKITVLRLCFSSCVLFKWGKKVWYTRTTLVWRFVRCSRKQTNEFMFIMYNHHSRLLRLHRTFWHWACQSLKSDFLSHLCLPLISYS